MTTGTPYSIDDSISELDPNEDLIMPNNYRAETPDAMNTVINMSENADPIQPSDPVSIDELGTAFAIVSGCAALSAPIPIMPDYNSNRAKIPNPTKAAADMIENAEPIQHSNLVSINEQGMVSAILPGLVIHCHPQYSSNCTRTATKNTTQAPGKKGHCQTEFSQMSHPVTKTLYPTTCYMHVLLMSAVE